MTAYVEGSTRAVTRQGDAEVEAHVLEANESYPNNDRLPVLLYRAAFSLPGHGDAAAVIEKIFARHGWAGSWRNGVYNYHHFHSNAHEVLGCYSGRASLLLGGSRGLLLEVARGDALLLPAGVAHKCLDSSPDFRVVGAYAHGRAYDLQRTWHSDTDDTLQRIAEVRMPDEDPVHGVEGPLARHWSAQRITH